MVDHAEVTPWPRKGQFWAHLEPLELVQVTCDVPTDENTVSFRRWHPMTFEVNKPEDDMVFLQPLSPTVFRYLWYDVHLQWTGHAGALGQSLNDVELPEEPSPGMAFIDTNTEEIFFVGPPRGKTRVGVVRILADWPVGEALVKGELRLRPYPPVPTPEPRGHDRYSVLKGDSSV